MAFPVVDESRDDSLRKRCRQKCINNFYIRLNLCYELVFHGFIHVNAEEALLVVASLKDDNVS